MLSLATLEDGYKCSVRGRHDKTSTDRHVQEGLWGGTGGTGSGKRSRASNSSWVAPWANFFCCCRLIY
jgi:hypothetical protein